MREDVRRGGWVRRKDMGMISRAMKSTFEEVAEVNSDIRRMYVWRPMPTPWMRTMGKGFLVVVEEMLPRWW